MSDEKRGKNTRYDGKANLVPTNKRSKEEARELGRIGGVKSGEVRREKKLVREIYAEVLAKKYQLKDENGEDIEVTGSDMIQEVIAAIIKRQDSASVSMIKELREGIDGSKVEHSGAIDMTTMTNEEFEAMKKRFLAEYLSQK